VATKVVMEALSPTMEEGRLVRWLKPEGASVANGDTLAEVETDKAIMELVARGDGVLRRQLVAEGATAPIGTLLGVIAAPNEDIAALVGAPSPAPAVAPAAAAVAPEAPVAVTTSESERVRSSPLARRLAAERGLDLHAIAGSGPNGRIVKRDLDGTAAPATTAAVAQAPAVVSPRTGADYTDIALTQIRRTIARRLAESIGPVPTFYLTAELDVQRVSEMRKAMAELGDDYKVSVNDIVLKAVATALAQHPEVNAHWLGDRIRQFARVHLGVAVAIDEGLITPVVFDADTKRLRDIAREVRELAARARTRKLRPEEYTGSTFSVSNLGMFGIDQFTAIINPPEAGILAIGAIEAKPVVVGETVVVRRRMRVTMSCDHRVIDGATGAKFLATLRRLIENPLLLVY
jgi:pyruvate dehydrogenase E2 component (dihydrolipoamide acetyltransferase)